MNVYTTLKRNLLKYPELFPNAFTVYHHWFCVIGNGYRWRNGQLINVCDTAEKVNNKDQAIISYLNHSLIDEWKEQGITRRFLKMYSGYKSISKYVLNHNERTVEYIKRILNTEERIKDFTIMKIFDFHNDDEFKFYPLSKFSAICNIPDDIKSDWLDAANKMYDILKNNMNLFSDEESKLWIPKIGERLNELNKK